MVFLILRFVWRVSHTRRESSKIVLRLLKGNTASNCGNRVRAVCNQTGRESAPVAWVMTKGMVKSQTDAPAPPEKKGAGKIANPQPSPNRGAGMCASTCSPARARMQFTGQMVLEGGKKTVFCFPKQNKPQQRTNQYARCCRAVPPLRYGRSPARKRPIGRGSTRVLKGLIKKCRIAGTRNSFIR